jgi:hypothetical protein
MVAPNDSFWGLTAKDLGLDSVANYSNPGFSFDHVLHILLNETVFDFANDYFLIGVPMLARFITFDDNLDITWEGQMLDSNFDSTFFPVTCLEKTQRVKLSTEDTFNREKARSLIEYYVPEWHDIQSLEKIFLLHQYLKSQCAKFMILNLNTPIYYQDLPAGVGIMHKVKQLPECVVFENTYYSVNRDDKIKPADFPLAGYYGHHGAPGNANYYNKVVKPKMMELNWLNNNA